MPHSMLSPWREPAGVVIGAEPDAHSTMNGSAELRGLGGVQRMMAQDMLGYLPNDILVKVDRAAMAVSLETRVPLLDREVVEFAWRVPLDLKIRDNSTKWLLRQVLYRHVPPELIERPKMGFGVPLDDWLRGPLRGWAEALLDERRLRDQGFFHLRPIRQAWDELLAGRGSHLKLWPVLIFQSWMEAQNRSTHVANMPAAAVAC